MLAVVAMLMRIPGVPLDESLHAECEVFRCVHANMTAGLEEDISGVLGLKHGVSEAVSSRI